MLLLTFSGHIHLYTFIHGRCQRNFEFEGCNKEKNQETRKLDSKGEIIKERRCPKKKRKDPNPGQET